MTKIWTIVPVKQLSESKSRLTAVLSPQEREQLTISMVTRLLELLCQADQIAQTIVVSADPQVQTLAHTFGMVATAEAPGSGLNGAVEKGVKTAVDLGATHVLILPSDLPLLTKLDLEQFLSHFEENVILICSDRSLTGTNAILFPVDAPFTFHYGVNSFEQHTAEANRLGFPIKTVSNKHIQFDLDTREDFNEMGTLP